MHDFADIERQAAAFLSSEPEYDEPAWVDMYANTLGRMKQHLSAHECTAAARAAFILEGWANPKVVALLDAQLGGRQ